MKYLSYIFILFSSIQGISQVNLDSLWSVWNDKSQADTCRLNAVNGIAWDGYMFTQPDSAFYYAQLQFDFAEEKSLLKFQGDALNTQGVTFYFRGDFSKAISYFEKCLIIRKEVDDFVGVAKVLNNLGIMSDNQGAPDEALVYYERSIKINRELNNQSGVASTLINMGIICENRGQYEMAIDHYLKGLKIYEELKESNGISSALNNIGLVYQDQGLYAQSIKYLTRSLQIDEEGGDLQGVATTLNNIGVMYINQKDYEKALEYYKRSLDLHEELEDKRGLADCYSNLGVVYKNLKDFDEAKKYCLLNLKIREKQGDKRGEAGGLNNLGKIYFYQKDFVQALSCFELSYSIGTELNDPREMARSLSNMSDVYQEKGNFKLAIKKSNEALEISKRINAKIEVKGISYSLYEKYKETGKYSNALEMYELYIVSRDSLNSEKNQKEIIRQEYKYIYDKQAATDSIKNAEEKKVKDAMLLAEKAQNKQHQLEAKQQKQQAYFLYAVLGLALLFAVFIFNRFRVTNKQKAIIEEQKSKVDAAFEELEEKNKEIMDSINYAKRIQSAILPPSKLVKEYLQESFILYKPKDVVAGDFYWMEHKDGKVLFAAADCTGHGVPGAMVSVVCNNGLNRSVREHGLSDPGKILDKTRQIVIQEFEKSEEDVKDGMDIALCSLEGMKLKYAGAHNPLWIIRKGEIIETKANKQPIGKFDKQTAYTTHSYDLEAGDAIYIFSDGYVDQFGGEKGKKFKSKAFRELLLSIQEKPMEEQKVIIDDAFEAWRGSLEQIDDVCVIGVRV